MAVIEQHVATGRGTIACDKCGELAGLADVSYVYDESLLGGRPAKFPTPNAVLFIIECPKCGVGPPKLLPLGWAVLS